jgi:hypothetical protein
MLTTVGNYFNKNNSGRLLKDIPQAGEVYANQNLWLEIVRCHAHSSYRNPSGVDPFGIRRWYVRGIGAKAGEVAVADIQADGSPTTMSPV